MASSMFTCNVGMHGRKPTCVGNTWGDTGTYHINIMIRESCIMYTMCANITGTVCLCEVIGIDSIVPYICHHYYCIAS